MSEANKLFLGRPWLALNVQADGECLPPPATECKDKLRCEMAYHIGPNVYSVTNLTRYYQCFVQLRKEPGRNPEARCNHVNCSWQGVVAHPYLCKHIRRAVKWHVRLLAKARAIARIRSSRGVTTEPQIEALLRAIR